jgi:mannose-6-phosphate isomerase
MADIVRARHWHNCEVIRIGPRLKPFAWGQVDAIPRLLGLSQITGPVAEAWFGAHESDPSGLEDGSDLAAHIAADPQGAVGGDRLPYLLKILAIESPLSIQVHPTMEQARVGYDFEEATSVDLVAPERTFRDPRHKPELIVALTPMRLLVGMRSTADLADDLRALGSERLTKLVEGHTSLLSYVIAVLGGQADAVMLERLADVPDGDTALALAGRAARAFPGDPGALVALAMNPVVLEPGEGCYVPPRVIHSYQSGIGVEIMANSDNVVRGGLTPKPIDVARLEAILDASPAGPLRPTVTHDGAATIYTVPVDDFELVRVEAGGAQVRAAARVVLAMDEATLTLSGGSHVLPAGGAAFVPLSDGPLTVSTEGVAFVALPGGGWVGADR